jgi:hypothetical protein
VGGELIKVVGRIDNPSADEMSEVRMTCLYMRVLFRLVSWAGVRLCVMKTSIRN